MVKVLRTAQEQEIVIDMNKIYLEQYNGCYFISFYNKGESIRISEETYIKLKGKLTKNE